jgi:hypothetical protein
MGDINITEPDNTYDFKKIGFGSLNRVSGETFQARIFSNNKPLFIQTPKSITKQGFVKTGKKMYCDLMFTNQDELFVNWIENLEATCQRVIYEKKTDWFSEEDKMDLHDIESAFTSLLKLYKSGKYYLIRTNVKPNIKIYDERGEQIAVEQVSVNSYMITVIEFQYIKFASKTFQIELEMKQCMIVQPDPFSESCFIKHTAHKTIKNIPEPKDSKGLVSDGLVSEGHISEGTEKIMLSLIEKIANEPEPEPKVKAMATVTVLEAKEEDNYPEDVATKMNTELNSVMKSAIQRKPSIGGDGDDDDDYGDGDDFKGDNIHIHGEAIDAQSLGIIEIQKDIGAIEINLKEINPNVDNSLGLETITLKKPNQVYYEMYKTARKKAKDIKKQAILAYLEAKNIKKTYMLEDAEDADSDFDEMTVNESDGE